MPEEALRDVDDKVLLLFSAVNCPAGHAQYLLARGASVNFCSSFINCEQGWTALAIRDSQEEGFSFWSLWALGEKTTIARADPSKLILHPRKEN